MTENNNSSSRSNTAVGLAIVLVIIVTIVGVWLLKSQSEDEGVLRQVTYQVEASGGYAQIIYTNSAGVNTEAGILTTPFIRTISFPVGQEVYLTASNPSQTGNISCRILINNREWKESKGTHPVDSVACAGIIK